MIKIYKFKTGNIGIYDDDLQYKESKNGRFVYWIKCKVVTGVSIQNAVEVKSVQILNDYLTLKPHIPEAQEAIKNVQEKKRKKEEYVRLKKEREEKERLEEEKKRENFIKKSAEYCIKNSTELIDIGPVTDSEKQAFDYLIKYGKIQTDCDDKEVLTESYYKLTGEKLPDTAYIRPRRPDRKFQAAVSYYITFPVCKQLGELFQFLRNPEYWSKVWNANHHPIRFDSKNKCTIQRNTLVKKLFKAGARI